MRFVHRIPSAVLAVALAAATVVALPPGIARAASNFTVDDDGDAGDANLGDNVCATAGGTCTLRAALEEAAAVAGPDTITFDRPMWIQVGSELTYVAGDDLTIAGQGMGMTVLDAGSVEYDRSNEPTPWIVADKAGAHRVLRLSGGILQLSDLTITGGGAFANVDVGGGGANLNGTRAALTRVEFTGNATGNDQPGGLSYGGALYSSATNTEVTDSRFVGNTNDGVGGAISATGGLTLVRTLVKDNGANFEATTEHATGWPQDFHPVDGGAVHGRARVEVLDSTFAGNRAQISGAIVTWGAGPTIVRDSTFEGNNANRGGGAIRTEHAITISDSRFVGNQSLGTYNGNPVGAAGAVSTGFGGTIVDSVFDGNRAELGGAIDNTSGPFGAAQLVIERTSIVNNAATVGGGVRSSVVTGQPESLVIRNSSIIGNSADTAHAFRGGGIKTEQDPALVEGSTIAFNTPGQIASDTITLRNSVVDWSAGGSQCAGVTLDGGNVIPNSGACVVVSSTATDETAGGDVLTRAIAAPVKVGGGQMGWPLATTSAARGHVTSCTGTDQRGVDRPATCDAGALHTNFVVDTLIDQSNGVDDGTCDTGGICSLREALQEANGDLATLAIEIAVSGEIALDVPDTGTGGELDIVATNVIVTAPGHAVDLRQTIAGERVLQVASDGALDVVGVDLDGDNSPVSSGPGDVVRVLPGGRLALYDLEVRGGDALNGGALGAEQAAVLLDGATFRANVADGNGGAIWSDDTDLTILDATFLANTAGDEAGAIHFDGNATLDIEGSTFENNEALAGDGGAIQTTSSGRLRVVDAVFTNNSATGSGGAVRMQAAPPVVVLERNAYNGNQATYGGGLSVSGLPGGWWFSVDEVFTANRQIGTPTGAGAALSVGGATIALGDPLRLAISGARFVDNHADQLAGAVYLVNDVAYSIRDTTFDGNHSDGTAGAMHIHEGAGGWLTDVTFTGNYAGVRGVGGELDDISPTGGTAGAIRSESSSDTQVFTRTTFTGNEAGYIGGAIWIRFGGLEIHDSSFGGPNPGDGNRTGAWGAALIQNDGDATVTNTVFQGNGHFATSTAPNTQGGAIFSGGALDISESAFVDNDALNSGGAIYSTGVLTVADTDFTGNRAGDGLTGGAITAKDLSVKRARFTANEGSRGGAIYLIDSTGGEERMSVWDSEFDGNVANGLGGAIGIGVLDLNTIAIDGSTFTNNQTDGNGGAIAVVNIGEGSTLDITQSTFANNTAQGSGSAVSLAKAPATATTTIDGASITGNTAVGSGAVSITTGHEGATTIVNSTIAGNATTGAAICCGGIYHEGGSLAVESSTLWGNSAPGGGGSILTFDNGGANYSPVDVARSIVGPIQNADCFGAGSTATGPLLLGQGTPALCLDKLAADGVSITEVADLGALGLDGHFETPNLGIDKYAPPCATPTDVRGTARPVGAACDLGAIESLVPAIPATLDLALTSDVIGDLSPGASVVSTGSVDAKSLIAATSATGPDSTPLSDITLLDAPLSDIPLSDIPLSDIPLSDIGLVALPLSDIPLSDIDLTLPSMARVLAGVPLNEVPVRGTVTVGGQTYETWDQVIALSTALAGSPLHTVSLWDVLNDPDLTTGIAASPLSDIPLSDIYVGESPLSDIPLVWLPLSDIGADEFPWREIFSDSQAATDVEALCNFFAQQGFDCTDLAKPPLSIEQSVAEHDVLELTIADAPLSDIPLSDIPLSDILLQDILVQGAPLSDIPLSDIPLSDIPLSDIPLSDIDLSASPLSDIPLSDIPLSDIPLSDIRFEGVPLSDIPLSDIPLSDIPLSDIPLSDIPLSDIPLSDIPLSDIFVQANLAGIPLSDIPLSDIPLSDIPLSDIDPQTGVYASPLSDIPLSDIPLSDIPLSDIPLSDIPLSDIPLSDIPLSDIPLSDIPLSDIPLSDIPLSDIPLSDIPLSDIFLQGIPLSDIPLSDIPLSDIDAFGTPLSDIPLSDIPLSDIPLSDIPLSDIPLSDIPLSDINTTTGVYAVPLSDIPLSDIFAQGIPLSDIPLSDIPLSDIANPDAVVDCQAAQAAGASCQAGSLGDVVDHLRPEAVLGLLAGATGTISLGQLLAMVERGGGNVALAKFVDTVLGDLTVYGQTRLGDLGRWAGTLLGDLGYYGALLLGGLGVYGQTQLGDLGTYGQTLLGDLTVYGQTLLGDLGTWSDTTVGQLGFFGAAAIGDVFAYSDDTIGQLAGFFGAVAEAGGTDYELEFRQLMTDVKFGELLGFGPLRLADLFLILGEATLRQVLLALARTPDLPGLTLFDLVLMLVPPSQYPWQDVAVGAGIQTGALEGQSVLYTLEGVLADAPPTTTLDIEINLPKGWYADGAGVPVTVGGLAAGNVDFTTTPDGKLATSLIVNGTSFLLAIPVQAGLSLGSQDATATVRSSVLGIDETISLAQVISEEFEPNDRPGDIGIRDLVTRDANGNVPNAANGLPDQLFLSHVSSATDVDLYSLQLKAGESASIYLGNIPSGSDFDLVVYGPAGTAVPGPPEESIPEDAKTSVHAAPANDVFVLPQDESNPATLRPIVGKSGANLTDSERVDLPTVNFDGEYLVQVAGYNGSFSVDPYSLRAKVFPAPQLPPCVDRTFPHNVAVTSSPANVTKATETLFLVNRQRYAKVHGGAALTALDDLLAQITAMDGDGIVTSQTGEQQLEARVNGAVVALDAYPAVNAAMAAFDAKETRCNVQTANDAVDAIRDVLSDLRREASVQHIVVIGDDVQIPFARVADFTEIANERTYRSSLADTETADELLAALAYGNYLTDDAYADSEAQVAVNRPIWIPEVPIGRLVETHGEISTQLQHFIDYNGRLDAATGRSEFVAGYDFLIDGSEAVADALASGTEDRLINETWSGTDLRNKLQGADLDVVSPNAHYDHSRLLPALDDANKTQADLVLESDLANQTGLTGSVVFTMGCHSGLSVSDVSITGGTTADWAQRYGGLAANYVGNTGFGYGETVDVALSELLMQYFAEGLNGDHTIGRALQVAKGRYSSDLTAYGVYDEKVLMEATMYGMPLYTVGGPPAPPAPEAEFPLTLDARSGLLAATDVDFDADQNPFVANTSPSGLWYTIATDPSMAADFAPQVTHDRPVMPRWTMDITAHDGLGTVAAQARGVVIEAMETLDVIGLDPVIGRPIVDDSKVEPEPTVDAVDFPTSFARTGVHEDEFGTTSTLSLIPGQFSGSSTMGEHALFDAVDMTAYYVDADARVDDVIPATILTVDGSAIGNGLSFDVAARDDNPIARVVALYNQPAADGSPTGLWRSVDLGTDGLVGPDGLQEFSGNVALAAALPIGTKVEFLVQVVDFGGRVSVSSAKATFHPAEAGAPADPNPAPPAPGEPAIVAPDRTSDANGYYGGPVTVAIIGDDDGDALVYVDGTLVDASTGSVTVNGTGTHRIVVVDEGVTRPSLVVRIDQSPPQVVFSQPNATDVIRSSVEPLDVAVALRDVGVGGAAVTASRLLRNGTEVWSGTDVPATVERDQVGRYRLEVDVVDLLGNAGTRAVEYLVVELSGNPDPVPVGSTTWVDVLGIDATDVVAISWGDGTFEDPVALVEQPLTGALRASHTYPSPGAYSVQVWVNDGLSVVHNYLVVYDPNAGHIVGSGRFWSDAGALVARPTVEGQAKFSFSAKYEGNQTVPTGKTTFKFKAGDLKFKSTGYDWLILDGARGQFIGEGKLNGQPGYGFTVVGLDGDIGAIDAPDRFRIAIWKLDEAGGIAYMVYDNAPGAAFESDAASVLTHGKVRIKNVESGEHEGSDDDDDDDEDDDDEGGKRKPRRDD